MQRLKLIKVVPEQTLPMFPDSQTTFKYAVELEKLVILKKHKKPPGVENNLV